MSATETRVVPVDPTDREHQMRRDAMSVVGKRVGDVQLTYIDGAGTFVDEEGREWEMTKEAFEKATADCMCPRCIERRKLAAAAPPSPAPDRGAEAMAMLRPGIEWALNYMQTIPRGQDSWKTIDAFKAKIERIDNNSHSTKEPIK